MASPLNITNNNVLSVTLNTTVVLLFATILVFFYFVYNKLFGGMRWEKYGVKHANFGIKEIPALMRERLMRDFGPTVGIFHNVPVLITRDLDLVKQILVKDFNSFPDRGDVMVTKSPVGDGVFFLKGGDWRRIRRLMSPSFSTSKQKQYSSHVEDAANSLAKAFETVAESGTNIDLIHVAGQYTTSVIAKTAFGLQADCIGQKEDDEFTHYTKTCFKQRSARDVMFILLMDKFPKLTNFLVKKLDIKFRDPFTPESTAYFNSILEETIQKREVAEVSGTSSANNDFLQSLVSRKIATDTEIYKTTGSTAEEVQNAPNVGDKKITKQEVIAQACFTILAAFETTSNTLQFCFYMLAQHPDVQQKVYDEIESVVLHERPTHEELSNLPYTKQVIDETLRLYPPVPFITRVAQETKTYGGITIPAGSTVTIPIREIHRDPSNYAEPTKFDADRFSDLNKADLNPLAFMPFGLGPRLCIGKRLALHELKIAIVQVLRKVKLELNNNTVPRCGEDIEVTFLGFPRANPPIRLATTPRL